MATGRVQSSTTMRSGPAGSSGSAGLPDLAAGSGRLCLDLVATVHDWPARQVELIQDLDALAHWFDLVELPTPVGGLTEQDLADTRALRAAVNDIARALLARHAPEVPVVRRVNGFAKAATPVFLMGASARDRVAVAEVDARAALAVIARDAVHLFTGPDLDRMRACEGCGSMFYDRSPSGRRRWCSMRRCGERVASASYRARRSGRSLTPVEQED
jgi:predicted RNA-binding Zn ribbon-like protein